MSTRTHTPPRATLFGGPMRAVIAVVAMMIGACVETWHVHGVEVYPWDSNADRADAVCEIETMVAELAPDIDGAIITLRHGSIIYDGEPAGGFVSPSIDRGHVVWHGDRPSAMAHELWHIDRWRSDGLPYGEHNPIAWRQLWDTERVIERECYGVSL